MLKTNSQIGTHKIRLSSVDSTNNFAAKLIKEGLGTHGSVILAENQTNGRGQRQSEWQSESAKNILTSFIFEFPALDSSSLFDVNSFVSVVLLELFHMYGIKSEIKWPNDILVKGKKISGILIENKLIGSKLTQSIAGIGINVNQKVFTNLNSVTSMQIETRMSYLVESIWISLIETFQKWEAFISEESKRKHLRNIYKNNLFGKDKERSFLIDEKLIQGIIRGVDLDGRLELEINGTLHFYQNKELEFL